ncbi:hypothetical protein D3C83_213920 [compost metagenome]
MKGTNQIAIPASATATRKAMPNIDEYHFGSSDITQSMLENVMTMTNIKRPMALHLRRESSTYGERSS